MLQDNQIFEDRFWGLTSQTLEQGGVLNIIAVEWMNEAKPATGNVSAMEQAVARLGSQANAICKIGQIT